MRIGRCFIGGFLILGGLLTDGCGEAGPTVKKTGKPPPVSSPATPKPAVRPRARIADSEEGSLKVRIPAPEAAEKIPVVDRTRVRDVVALDASDPGASDGTEKLSRKEKAVRDSLRTPRPARSLAEKLSRLNEGKVIKWSPQWISDGAGGVRLPAFAVSPDRDMIVIVETLGEPGGPFGSRLVFLDTHSWTIAAVHHLWKEDIRHLAIAPNGVPVLVSRGQEALKTPDEILLFDPWSGQITKRFAEPDAAAVYPDADNRIFVTRRKTSDAARKIAVYTGLFEEKPPVRRELESVNRTPVAAFSADGKSVLLAGDRTLEVFKSSDLRLRDSYPLPENFVTVSLLEISPDTVILAPEPSLLQPALRLCNGEIRRFGENSEGVLAGLPASKGKLFCAVMSRRGRISLRTASTLEEWSGVDPEEGRPRTVGNPRLVLAFSPRSALAVLDAHGSFYLLYKDPSGKRWRKELLISAAGREKKP